MTFTEMVGRLRSLGFACAVDSFDGGRTRAIVAKLHATAGNRLAGAGSSFSIDEGGRTVTYLVDEPCPELWERVDGFEFSVNAAVPLSSGAYVKRFATADEVCEEVLHYFFDADSPMRLEAGFQAGPGRPPSPT